MITVNKKSNEVDKRKKYYCNIDVETAGGLEFPLIYDVGFAIFDKKGNVVLQCSYLITEIFDNIELMQTAYYCEKIPMYMEKLKDGIISKVSFNEFLRIFKGAMDKYNVDVLCAYNLLFDTRALKTTHKFLINANYREYVTNFLLKTDKQEISKGGYKKSSSTKVDNYGLNDNFQYVQSMLLRKPITFLCIYNFASQVIATQKMYLETAFINKWYSDKGNVKTNAQCIYAYISGQWDFVEEHTGLSDTLIEIEILIKCFNQRKKFDKKITSVCWRYPQKQFKELVENKGGFVD